jgi:hypothetical protein
MKSVAHAWLGLMAIKRIEDLKKDFDSHYKKQAKKFLEFFRKHRDAFVQGAWFPDSVISDNLTGGHTYKLRLPSKESEKEEAKKITDRTPPHLSSVKLIKDKKALDQKLYKPFKYTLPDRCEALAHAIRDMTRIRDKVAKGSDVMFNDDQITLYFLMLSHYLADAHVPPHCDDRDFYTPSTIHPDMEGYWDEQVKACYPYDTKAKVFDYDLKGYPQPIDAGSEQFQSSFLAEALEILKNRKWDPADEDMPENGKNKIYDYIKAVCLVSYVVSSEFISLSMKPAEYKKLKILEDPNYFDELKKMSPHVFADAIDSIALIWLITWDKHFKLKEGIAEKNKEIAESEKKAKNK